MRGPANERVQVFITDFEIDIQPIQRACLVQVAQQILHHRVVVVAFAVRILRRLLTHLYPR
jgi:hypothetical protein